VEAKILFTNTGLTLPLKRFSKNQTMQTLEIAGLYGYNEKSDYKRDFVAEHLETFSNCFIQRLDVAVDFSKKIPRKVIVAIKKFRKKTFKIKGTGTTYFKSLKEKKTNTFFDVKIYDKATKENLNCIMQRLELCFKKPYFKNITLAGIEMVYEKIIKTFKKYTGLEIQISPFTAPISYIV
jgi:hypothetical protein